MWINPSRPAGRIPLWFILKQKDEQCSGGLLPSPLTNKQGGSHSHSAHIKSLHWRWCQLSNYTDVTAAISSWPKASMRTEIHLNITDDKVKAKATCLLSEYKQKQLQRWKSSKTVTQKGHYEKESVWEQQLYLVQANGQDPTTNLSQEQTHMSQKTKTHSSYVRVFSSCPAWTLLSLRYTSFSIHPFPN